MHGKEGAANIMLCLTIRRRKQMAKFLKKVARPLRKGEKGFTLIG
jgi:hypothetical protein